MSKIRVSSTGEFLESGFEAAFKKLQREVWSVRTLQGNTVRKMVRFNGWLCDMATGQLYDPRTHRCLSSGQLRLGRRIDG